MDGNIGGSSLPRRWQRKGRPPPERAGRAAPAGRRSRKAGDRQRRHETRRHRQKVAAFVVLLALLVLTGLQTADTATRRLLGLPPREPALLRVSGRPAPPYFSLELFGRSWPR